MDFHNHTPFPALAFESIAPCGTQFHVVVLRQTLELRDGELVFARIQKPLATTDRFHGEPNRSSVAEESDLAPYKPRCDVVVSATAYAPQQRPVPRFSAAVRIEAVACGDTVSDVEQHTAVGREPLPHVLLDHRIIVTGPRSFVSGDTWALTDPKPISALPVRYEYAWGGQCRVNQNDPAAERVPAEYLLTPAQQREHPDQDNLPVVHTVCDDNPVGIGYAEPWFIAASQLVSVPAPQIEQENDPVTVERWIAALSGDRTAMPPPAGLGIIGKAWLSRRALAGTYDERWLRERHPMLPEDFRFSYWNGAHTALQVPHLKGDETVVLTNLAPPGCPATRTNAQGNTVLHIKLPGHLPMGWLYTDSALKFAAFLLDTVSIDVPEDAVPNVTLVWRATVWKTENGQCFEARFVDRDEIARLASRRDAVRGAS